MSKREATSDDSAEGPPPKVLKEDYDDSGGRIGRVRKKSAKLLEMEEFEQAEKVHHKKGKAPKTPTGIAPLTPGLGEEVVSPVTEKVPVVKKSKIAKALSAGLIPVSSLPSPPPPQTVVMSGGKAKAVIKMETGTTPLQNVVVKQELSSEATSTTQSPVTVKQELDSETGDNPKKSVIKYLLNSPAAGSKPSVSLDSMASPSSVQGEAAGSGSESKKSGKKTKSPSDKSAQKSKAGKEKKVKVELPEGREDSSTGTLKMKITSGSNPSSTMAETVGPVSIKIKVNKKGSKKHKGGLGEESFSIMSPAELEALSASAQEKKPTVKKFSKKKEKLIQDAVSAAAKQMPNLAALVATPSSNPLGQQVLSTQSVIHKVKPKKKKFTSPKGPSDEELPHKSDLSFDGDEGDEEEESSLVIAETEKKKKKVAGLKKKAGKGKSQSSKDDPEKKKLPKRPPTAYMLFCNTHRPGIVLENPGIEFAGISRKLGELWSTLSSKQKMQWKRKAQRRTKKGSNLISTGKGGKDAVLAPVVASSGPMVVGKVSGSKVSRTLPEETPQSPTNKNFSIEPIDVAAHLKLLGESLSIIGMRLQEHKGMIAVQGSLSVLLDSLICACGPLLCLTQQVPGMDGCPPSVHAKTLDSVAYVMPGL